MRTLLTIPHRLNKLFVMVAALVLAVSAHAQNFTTNGVLQYNFWTNANSLPPLESASLGAPATSVYTNFAEVLNTGSIFNYVDQLVGVFIPPVPTNYVFWVSSDDNSDLFLSTDISPAHRKFIAQ